MRTLTPLVFLLVLGACKGQSSDETGSPTATDPGDTDCGSEVFDTPGMLVRLQAVDDALFLMETDGTDAGFAPPRQIHAGVNDDSLRNPMLVDIDGDGSLEIVGSRDGLWILEYDGCTDSWDAAQVLTDEVRVATSIDADMDGDLDLVTFQLDTGVGPLLVNDGTGGFTVDADAYDLSTAFGGYRVWPAQHAADADGDGDEDFAVVA